jgi:ribosomal protein S12 methylthiotransferase accessory factor
MQVSLEQPLRKVYRNGAHRVASPEETLARLRPIALRCGITRLGNVTGLDRLGIPVAVAVRPRSLSVAVSQGKGVTLAQAKASALMEAIELFHGEDLAPRCRLASLAWLRASANVIALDRLSRTGKRLSPWTAIPWIEGHDLSTGATRWVPAEVVHTDFTTSHGRRSHSFLATTNGLASGNHILEAIGSAVCEVIERDAVAVWERRSTGVRAACHLDLESVDDPVCRSLIEQYGRAEMEVRVWDVTSDCRVPAFACEIQPRAPDPAGQSRRFRGAGCHPSRAIALSRALTEAAQVRLTHITGMRNDIFSEAYEDTLGARAGAALLDARAASLPSRAFGETPTFESDDIAADVRWLLQRLREAGFGSVVMVDLTKPELGIPVVRVVVPGLEGYSAAPEYRPGARAIHAGAQVA